MSEETLPSTAIHVNTAETVVVNAIISKLTTTIDGGWRVTLDVPESEQANVLKLAELMNEEVHAAIVPLGAITETKTDG